MLMVWQLSSTWDHQVSEHHHSWQVTSTHNMGNSIPQPISSLPRVNLYWGLWGAVSPRPGWLGGVIGASYSGFWGWNLWSGNPWHQLPGWPYIRAAMPTQHSEADKAEILGRFEHKFSSHGFKTWIMHRKYLENYLQFHLFSQRHFTKE